MWKLKNCGRQPDPGVAPYLLQLFIREVDQQLLVAVLFEDLESSNIEHPD
jgi:hypothetical protein